MSAAWLWLALAIGCVVGYRVGLARGRTEGPPGWAEVRTLDAWLIGREHGPPRGTDPTAGHEDGHEDGHQRNRGSTRALPREGRAVKTFELATLLISAVPILGFMGVFAAFGVWLAAQVRAGRKTHVPAARLQRKIQAQPLLRSEVEVNVPRAVDPPDLRGVELRPGTTLKRGPSSRTW